MSRSTSPPEVDRRSVVLAAAITIALSLAYSWPDRQIGKMQSEFTLGGLAMIVCWGLLAVVARPARRAVVRGVAGGVVLGLVLMMGLTAGLTGIWVLLLPFNES